LAPFLHVCQGDIFYMICKHLTHRSCKGFPNG
jgi:hypothetical protein